MTFKKLIGLSMIMILAFSLATMTSCSKKEGCMSQYSDNYDSEAEEDDGSCIPWSDKFVGEYIVTLDCSLFEALETPFPMTISATGETSVLLTLKTTAFGTIPISAIINDKDLTFNEFVIDGLSQEFEIGGTIITLNKLVINGNAVSGTNGDLTGSISILANDQVTDNCSMIAVKQ